MWEQSTLYAEFVFLIFKIFLAVLHSMWDLSYPTRDRTHTLRSEVLELRSLSLWTSGPPGKSWVLCFKKRVHRCGMPTTLKKLKQQANKCVQAPVLD